MLLLRWKEIITIIFVGISATISSAIGNWHFLLLIAIPIMVAIVEQFVTSNYLLKKALRKVLPLIEKAFEKKVRKQMSIAELKHQEKIMQETKDQTDILKKCEDLLKQ